MNTSRFNIKNFSSCRMRKFVDDASNEMLSASNEKKSKIKQFFIDALDDSENYKYFSFGEFVMFFLHEFDEFDEKEKEKILKHVCNNLYIVCHAKNDMVPLILFDFITRYVDKSLREDYCNRLLDIGLDKETNRCLKIIINGFFSAKGVR